MGDNGYEHGKMDISAQERTFASFIRFVSNACILIAIFLILLYAING